MQDRHFQIQLTSTLAALSGCVGIALVVVNFFVDGDDFGNAGLLFACIAAVLRIRSWFVRMGQRERNAFEIGRDSVRSLR